MLTLQTRVKEGRTEIRHTVVLKKFIECGSHLWLEDPSVTEITLTPRHAESQHRPNHVGKER